MKWDQPQLSLPLSLLFARTTLNTVFDSAEYPLHLHRQARLPAHVLWCLGHQMLEVLRDLSVQLGSRFAKFADVPYQDPLTRQQWEHLWELEPDTRRIHTAKSHSVRDATATSGRRRG